MQADARLQIEAVVATLSIHAWPRSLQVTGLQDHCLRPLLVELLQALPPYTPDDVERIARILASRGRQWNWWLPVVSLMASIQARVAEDGLTSGARTALHNVSEAGFDGGGDASGRKALATIEAMLGIEEPKPLIDDRDDWGAAASLALRMMDAPERQFWSELLEHAGSLSTTRPSTRWMRSATTHVEKIGRARAREVIVAWLALLDTASLNDTYRPYSGDPMAGLLGEVPTIMITARNASVLTGLVWTTRLSSRTRSSRQPSRKRRRAC